MSKPNGLQEATALNGFGYIADPSTAEKRIVFSDYNGIQMQGEDVYNLSKEITLSSAQLLALYATPVEVLPSAPEGFFYVVNKWLIESAGGTTPYTIPSNAIFELRNSGGGVVADEINPVSILNVTSTPALSVGDGVNNTSYAPIIGSNIRVTNTVGALTLGNFEVKLKVFYNKLKSTYA